MTVVFAMLLDAALGEPRWLWSRIPHPAVLFGRLIERVDRDLNKGDNRREKGAMLLTALVLGGGVLGWLISALPFGSLWELIIGAALLAHRSLIDHVQAVAQGLRLSLADGRMEVAKIVGRDMRDADAPAITRAAIESAAENFSDGVVAPVFWFLIFGLPGIIVYKLVNTADSMIGYRNPRYEEFGWAAARFDDLLNWIPARLTALLILLLHGRLHMFAEVRADAALHRSPNAGWPESAVARILNVALAGPRSYDGRWQDFPYVHPEGVRTPGPAAIDQTITLLWKSWGAMLVIVALTGLL